MLSVKNAGKVCINFFAIGKVFTKQIQHYQSIVIKSSLDDPSLFFLTDDWLPVFDGKSFL